MRTCASTSFGLIFWPTMRRMVKVAGYDIRPAFGNASELAVWGRVPKSRKLIDSRAGANVITFEDAFLRSVVPGQKTPPIGLTIDDLGVHFDCSQPSQLEEILQNGDLDDADLLTRAANGRAFLAHYGMSKYNLVPRGYGRLPDTGYVLVVDQVKGDASIEYGGANTQTFADMLAAAQADNPGKKILIKTHPAASGVDGHFSKLDVSGNVTVHADDANIWDLLEGASKVYCVTSLVGFEAIMAGHKPVVFGLPFYAGWGLTSDQQTVSRRIRKLSVDQLFAGAMLLYPFWYDRTRRRECSFEEMTHQLLAETRHRWDGLKPSYALGMRLWKRKTVQNFLAGAGHMSKFAKTTNTAISSAKTDGQVVVWAGQETDTLATDCKVANVPLIRMEDGFLRSVGLGAELTPASSLVLDNCGIYYDPTKASQLENLIRASVELPEFARARATELCNQIVTAGVTKYNLPTEIPLPSIVEGKRKILVVGQVEDDASILKGAGDIRTNSALLAATRSQNPDAYIIYKPHPDVMAGLRDGAVSVLTDCDYVAEQQNSETLIEYCDEVWTMTSLLGFEALVRGKQVVCYGMPFYAGWGLTRDLGEQCARRAKGIELHGLIHAALIDYPRYMDPISGIACPPETIVERLSTGKAQNGLALRLLAKLQGALSSYAHMWR